MERRGVDASHAEVERDIMARDEKTLQRKIAPLRQAEDAVRLDTTNLSTDEVVNRICAIAESRRIAPRWAGRVSPLNRLGENLEEAMEDSTR